MECYLIIELDLDWNSVRYLQSCESGKDSHTFTQSRDPHESIISLNFQLIPYPWFKTRQAKLYPEVIFPDILPGVSTSRDSKQNAILVARFIDANIASNRTVGKRTRPHVFLDMQVLFHIYY